MKKTSILLLACVVLFACQRRKESEYLVSGTVKGADTGMVYLQKMDSLGWKTSDSAALKKGAFEFKGSVLVPESYKIKLRGAPYSYQFFLENSGISLVLHNDSTAKIEVTGSSTEDIYNQYVAKDDSINRDMKQLDEQYSKADAAGDTATKKKLEAKFDAMDKGTKELIASFAKSHGKSVVGPYLVIHNSYRFELPDLQAIASAFDSTIQSSVYVKQIKTRIGILKAVEIGQPAVQFTMNDTAGNPVALSSLKGKFLLVDFWASWCGPCRGENPNVVKAYQSYHAKGFDVLGVSFDRNREKWVKAIRDDKLTWNHVSDLKQWGNAAGKLYGINSIPANVLLDKDQVIIGKNLRGEDLMKKLNELLGPPAKLAKAGKTVSKKH